MVEEAVAVRQVHLVHLVRRVYRLVRQGPRALPVQVAEPLRSTRPR